MKRTTAPVTRSEKRAVQRTGAATFVVRVITYTKPSR
jgi:hypothetical protein